MNELDILRQEAESLKNTIRVSGAGISGSWGSSILILFLLMGISNRSIGL